MTGLSIMHLSKGNEPTMNIRDSWLINWMPKDIEIYFWTAGQQGSVLDCIITRPSDTLHAMLGVHLC